MYMLLKFSLLMVLGSAITCWNVRTAMITMQIGSLPNVLREDGCTIEPLKYVERLSALYQASQESSKREDLALRVADGKLSGRAHLGHQYFLLSAPGTKNLTRWSLDGRLRSYVDGSVVYDRGSLVAEVSGYYYVYSQVSFVQALKDWAADQSAVTHELLRYSTASNVTQTLLRVQKTHRWDKMFRCSLDASYLGATFHLQKGDRIYVAVFDTNFMWQSSRRTYFGMRML